jgi:hypothetical protein
MGAMNNTSSPLGAYHALIECYHASGYSGVGRLGADFWRVLKGRRGMSPLVNRYGHRNRPGPPTIANGALLYPGEEGPAATVRLEAMRLGIQEAEARIEIERALGDKAAKEKLGEPGREATALLDERVRAIRRGKSGRECDSSEVGWLSYAWGVRGRARRLFDMAGRVQGMSGEAEVSTARAEEDAKHEKTP